MYYKILYLEDDLHVQRAISRMLHINYPQFNVHTCEDVQQAITALEQHPFDLVISDYNVRNGTGGDVLEWLRANKPSLVEKFIFLASADEIEGHMHWLKKPANMQQLRAIIDRIL